MISNKDTMIVSFDTHRFPPREQTKARASKNPRRSWNRSVTGRLARARERSLKCVSLCHASTDRPPPAYILLDLAHDITSIF